MLARPGTAAALFHPLVVGECAEQEDIEPAANIERWDRDPLVDFLRSCPLPVVIVAAMGQPVEVVRSHPLRHRHISQWKATIQGEHIAKGRKYLSQVLHPCLARLELVLLFGQSKAECPLEDKAKLKCAGLICPALVVVSAGNG